MSKKFFSKIFVTLLVVGLFFGALPVGQVEAASYVNWIAQLPGEPSSADTVRIWIDSNTSQYETILVEYKIGETSTKVEGVLDTSFAGANWRADIPAQAAGTVVSYQLIVHHETGGDWYWTGFNWSYTVTESSVKPVHNTTQGTHFSTIQAAVTVADEGDVIEVDAGTYNEALIINKPITLTGAGDDLSIIDGTGLTATPLVSVTDLTSGALSISGFTFMDDDVLSADFNPVSIYDCQSPATVIFTDNTILGTNTSIGTGDPIEDRGLLIQGGNCAHTIKNNVFDNIGSNAILVEKATGPVEIGNNEIIVPNGNISAAIWSMSYGTELAPNTVTGLHWYHDNIIRAKTDGDTISGGIGFGTAWSAEGWNVNQYGSYLDVLVENNTIEDFTGAGIAVEVDGEHSTFDGVIQNNTLTASADLGTGIALSGPVNNTSILSNIVTDAQRGIYLTGSFGQAYYPTDITIEKNQLAGNVYGLVEIDAANDQDISPNWWGSATGPTIGQIDGNTSYTPWCADAACTTTAPDAGGNIYLSGMINAPGGILIGTPGLKYHLAANTIIQNDSPCFIIEASNTIIVAEPGAKCIPTDSSNGIDVAAGLSGITIDGLEIDGTGQTTGDGIHFAGAVSDIVLVDNKIHDLDGDGIEFAGNVSEVVNIQGNIFKANGGLGINNLGANIVGAEYNSWGDVAGPTGTNGVGVSAKVTYEPFTHADLYLVSSGTPWANQVVNGKEITYTVKAHLVNVNAADFYLEYPANLTYVSHTAGNALGIYDAVTHDSATRKLHFIGYSISGNKTGDLALFNVTFRANSTVVEAPLSFSFGNTSGFGMASYESSSNVFANELVDSSVTIVELPTMTPTDIQGYYLTGEQRQFSVVLDNPTDGADYAHVYVNYKLTGADMDEISLLEYSADGGTTWQALGADPGTTYGEDGLGNIVGYFGKMDGGGFPFAPDTSRTFLFRVSFVTREQADVDFPNSYAVSMQLRDADALPDSNLLDELTDTMYVYDPATVTVMGDQYYLIGEPGAFTVTINNPVTGKNYDNTVVFDIVITDIGPTDFTTLTCNMADRTWDLLSSLTPDGTDVVARIVGDQGFFTVPPTGVDMVITCSVTYATAGTHETSGEMIEVDIEPEPDAERAVSTNTSVTAAVYTAPVITATFPTGTYVAGQLVTVPISITNPDNIPGPFSLDFDLPAGTSFTFGGHTYSCTETGCPVIPVTLPITDAELVITFDGGYTGSLGLSLYDTSLEPDGIFLASFSQTGVEVLSAFSVTGTVSMQGRSAREGVQLILTGSPGIYTATSTSLISNNYVFEDVAEGTYTFTTYQPRYLNITADSGKTLTLAGAETLTSLTLVGGNAFWWDFELDLPDNVIDYLDLGVVSLGYTAGIELHPDADVNFDNLINIQDLAQVAGSYDLQSDDPDGLNFAYSDWQP